MKILLDLTLTEIKRRGSFVSDIQLETSSIKSLVQDIKDSNEESVILQTISLKDSDTADQISVTISLKQSID